MFRLTILLDIISERRGRGGVGEGRGSINSQGKSWARDVQEFGWGGGTWVKLPYKILSTIVNFFAKFIFSRFYLILIMVSKKVKQLG